MNILTIALAGVLIVLGVVAYLASGMASVTALIPSFAGGAFLLCGLLACKASMRMHAMHVAALLALVGIGGSATGFTKLPAVVAGTAERPAAAIMQSIMATLLIIYLVLCIKSFIAARKARKAAEAAAG